MNRRQMMGWLSVWFGLAMVGTAAGAAAPAAVVTGSTPAPDGVSIAYTIQGEGKPVLVFVHGWCCDQTYWRAQVPHFSRRHRVVTVDLAGHGRSGRGRTRYTVAAFAGDVQAVVTALDLERVVLVGHSLGGPVIVEAARLLPDRVIGLVPVDTLQSVERRITPEQAAGYLESLEADFAQGAQAFIRQNMFIPTSDPALIDRIATDMAQGPPEVGLSALREIFSYWVVPALEAVRVPLRCINSDKYPTDLDAGRRHLPGFEVVYTPGVGHFNMIEDPATFNQLLDGFLATLPAAPAGESR